MKQLHKLTIKYFVGPFIATFFIALFVLIMQFLWKYIDDMAGKGLEWYVIVELLFYASAHLIPLALPLAVLLSSIMTMGSMAENYELMAFKSGGVSLFKILKPLFVIMIAFSIGAFFFSNNALPKANLKFGALLWDVKTQKPAFDLIDGVFYAGIEDYIIRVGEKDENSQNVNDVLIYDHTVGAENNIVIRAEKGKLNLSDNERWLIFTLYNGYRYEEIRDQKDAHLTWPHSKTKFSEFEIRFDLSSFEFDRTNIELFKGNYKMLNISELNYFTDSVKNAMEDLKLETRGYIRPYLYILRDSTLSKAEPRELEFDSANFIHNFPSGKRQDILERAASNAKTVKFVLQNPSTMKENLDYSLARYRIEWHRKIVISISIMLLFLIGAPLGAIIRKGGLGAPSVVSILIFILYYIITITGEKLARKLVLDPFTGMWLPVFVILPISFFLTYKSNRDSIIFNKESFSIFVSKKLEALGFRKKV